MCTASSFAMALEQQQQRDGLFCFEPAAPCCLAHQVLGHRGLYRKAGIGAAVANGRSDTHALPAALCCLAHLQHSHK
jgi:hypothetical protein